MQAEWESIAGDLAKRWNSYNCIGAMDGKRTLINLPPNSGSYYCNCKGTFSVVLALVDADYQFMYVDIECNGRVSDGGVFKNIDLHKHLQENYLSIPSSTTPPNFPIHCHT